LKSGETRDLEEDKMSDERAPMIKLGGLWRTEGKDGSVFFSGKLGYGTRLLLFKNQHKRSDKDPDLVIYLAKSEEKKREAPAGDADSDPFVPF